MNLKVRTAWLFLKTAELMTTPVGAVTSLWAPEQGNWCLWSKTDQVAVLNRAVKVQINLSQTDDTRQRFSAKADTFIYSSFQTIYLKWILVSFYTFLVLVTSEFFLPHRIHQLLQDKQINLENPHFKTPHQAPRGPQEGRPSSRSGSCAWVLFTQRKREQ